MNKKILKDKLHSQDGIALLEVLLAVMLVTVVLGVAIAIFSQGQLIYTKGQEKVDAQSQLRIAMNNVKRQLSVATRVEIANATGPLESGTLYFYIKENTLVLNAPDLDSGRIESIICQPLPGLVITFSVSPLDTNNKMLRVHMTTEEGAELNSDVLIQNTTTGIKGLDNNGDGLPDEGSVLIFESIE
jgi:competence protein ComGC